jgi:hypothetical protein
MWGLVGLALSGAPAHAEQVPVFHNEGNPNIVLGAVVVATGEAPASFRMVTAADAFHGLPPRMEGAPALVPCGSAPNGVGALVMAVASAEQGLNYMETDKVVAALAQGESAIDCLDVRLPAAQAARLQFLAGIAAIQRGDKGAAWDHFRAAWNFDNDVAWDDAFPPSGLRVFKLAVAEAQDIETVGVELMVPAPKAGFWVNGVDVPHGAELLELTPGKHVLQWSVGGAIQTHRMVVPEGSRPRLAIPALVPADFPHWIADANTQDLVDDVLRLHMADGQTAFMVAGGGTWKGTVGAGAWQELVAPAAAVIADLPPREGRPAHAAAQPMVMDPVTPGGEVARLEAAPMWAKLGTPVLAAVGVGMAAYAASQSKTAADLGADYNAAMNEGKVLEATQAYEQRHAAERSAGVAWGVAGATLLGAGGGAFITFTVSN